MSINLFTRASEPCFSNIRGAFSKPADSTSARIQNLAIALILLPLLVIKDLADLMARPFRKIEPLTNKEKFSIATNKAVSEVKKLAGSAKTKAINAAKTTKEFANKNQFALKIATVAASSIGLIYLSRNISLEDILSYFKTPSVHDNNSNSVLTSVGNLASGVLSVASSVLFGAISVNIFVNKVLFAFLGVFALSPLFVDTEAELKKSSVSCESLNT